VYYEPATWHLLKTNPTFVWDAARKRLEEVLAENLDANRDENGAVDEIFMETFKLRAQTLRGMLEHYFKWAPLNDQFTPVKIEIEFEVPILDTNGDQMYCRCHRWPVNYQGRLDGLVKDWAGRYWILEHKTTGQMGRTDHLALDSQTGSYCWAMAQLGIVVAGVIYSQALKDYPEPPVELKSPRQGRNFSVNKQQRTTYDEYLKALQDAGENVSLYDEFLQYLKEKGNPFFRRMEVHRNKAAIDYLGSVIYMEATEMLSPDLLIYPNPGYFNCNGCRFREPCIAKQDGHDYKFLLDPANDMFQERV
jgi:CRISPR/Cas system-associated exonuclease Cas4 (RecB family)